MTGRVWKFGDDVNTDLLAPGIYMKLPLHELASHCLETLAPEFSTQVLPGDFVVGGLLRGELNNLTRSEIG